MKAVSSAKELREEWRRYEELSIRDQYPPLPHLEALLKEEDAGFDRIFSVDVKGSTNTMAVLTALKGRRSELVKVTKINATELSKEEQQTLFELLSEANVREVYFQAENRAIMFPDELANHKLWPKLRSLVLEKIVINKQAMKDLCEGLAQRVRPIEYLRVDFEHCSKDALLIFGDSISRIRLATLTWCPVEQDDLYTLCDQLNQCNAVRSVSITSPSAYQWSHKMMEALTKAFQQMPSLEEFGLMMVDVVSEEQIFGLGRLVASRPSLKSVTVLLLQPLCEGLATAFFKGCGFHPNLSSVKLSTTYHPWFERREDEYLQVSRSWRARCLVVLVAGATLQRVGAQSPLWLLSSDILRNLLPFLNLSAPPKVYEE